MSEVIVSCLQHCSWCCPRHGLDTEEARARCDTPWHTNYRERMAKTANYYAGKPIENAATAFSGGPAAQGPQPPGVKTHSTTEPPTVVEGRAVCPSCGHAMERAACHDRCEACGFMLDCTDGG